MGRKSSFATECVQAAHSAVVDASKVANEIADLGRLVVRFADLGEFLEGGKRPRMKMNSFVRFAFTTAYIKLAMNVIPRMSTMAGEDE